MWTSGAETTGKRLLWSYLAVVVLSWLAIAVSYLAWDTEAFHDLLLGEDQIVDTAQQVCYVLGVVIALLVGVARRRTLHLGSQVAIASICVLALLEKTSYLWLLRDNPPLIVGTKPLDSLHDLNEVAVQFLGTTGFITGVAVLAVGLLLARHPILRAVRRLSRLHRGWPYAMFAFLVIAVAMVIDALTPYMTIRGGWLAEYLLKLAGSTAMLAATLAALLPVLSRPDDNNGPTGERVAGDDPHHARR